MGMAKRYSDVTASIETHWSLFSAVRDNWGFAMTALGLGGLQGWLLWIWQAAIAAPLYQKALVISFGVIITVFFVTGVQAFLASYKRSARESDAIATGLSRSGYAYTNGSIIEGGTHRLTEIFGNDQLRSNLIFRNCQILGPGIVAHFASDINKTECFGTPGPQFIQWEAISVFSPCVFHFVRCRFDNCVFANIIQLGGVMPSGPDAYYFRLERLPANPPDARPPSPAAAGKS
jgi:hypothetical protein